jgi:hypothetical protein
MGHRIQPPQLSAMDGSVMFDVPPCSFLRRSGCRADDEAGHASRVGLPVFSPRVRPCGIEPLGGPAVAKPVVDLGGDSPRQSIKNRICKLDVIDPGRNREFVSNRLLEKPSHLTAIGVLGPAIASHAADTRQPGRWKRSKVGRSELRLDRRSTGSPAVLGGQQPRRTSPR